MERRKAAQTGTIGGKFQHLTMQRTILGLIKAIKVVDLTGTYVLLLQINSLLDSICAPLTPHAELDDPLELGYDEEGVVVLVVDGQLLLGERLHVRVRPVRDDGVRQRHGLEALGVGLERGGRQRHLGRLGLDRVRRAGVVVAGEQGLDGEGQEEEFQRESKGACSH